MTPSERRVYATASTIVAVNGAVVAVITAVSVTMIVVLTLIMMMMMMNCDGGSCVR